MMDNLLKIKTEEITQSGEKYFGELVHSVLEKYALGLFGEFRDCINSVLLEQVPYWKRASIEAKLLDFFDFLSSNHKFRSFWKKLRSGILFPELDILGEKGQRLRVDLLVKLDRKIMIIEYKTGVKVQSHVSQLLQYCSILSNCYENIEGYLFYLRYKEVELLRVN